MAQIPFTVSARTARLIGRENIASSKGAIVELVKNCYDADSSIAIIYFKRIIDTIIEKEIVDGKEVKSEKKVDNSELFIIDAGEGMTGQIIKKYWMTIGTNNKESDFFTKSGRVKAGAKGIGRFALDKLGDKCEMITKFNPEIHKDLDEDGSETSFKAYHWEVDWTDFEGDGKTIDQVKAILFGSEDLDLKDYILREVDDDNIKNILEKEKFENGTIFKISNLRDNWEDHYVNEVFKDLEVLVPPKESNPFKISLFSKEYPKKYGEVLGSICDDYDYKLSVTANDNQSVSIKIFRKEYIVDTIPPKFFMRDFSKEYPYRKEDFEKGYWERETTFKELLAGYDKKDEDNTFSKIGNFQFDFYFMKKTYMTEDLSKFYYKKFVSRDRKNWLDKFGGIKLFRDDFRVRPYGEVENSAFDWLGLGMRQTKSPASIAKKEGGWKVNPENVAGAINITRVGNVDFQDKSSREGLQENKTFLIFRKLILSIIEVFEEDRAKIASEMKLFYEEIDDNSKGKKYVDDLAKKILEKERTKNNEELENNSSSENHEKEDPDKILLSKRLEDKNEEIENLKEEQKLLRGMASSGIVVASFSHDLSKISQNLNSRVDKLKKILDNYISEDDLLDLEDRKNPFYILERIKKQDVKLQNWLHFSLGVARKDKRKTKTLKFKSYFSLLKDDWETIFNNRGIIFNIEEVGNLSMRVYEIDIDSIFNNLIINTINAFIESQNDNDRIIKVKVYDNKNELFIDYIDNGPGLSEDILNHEKIFEPMFTTNLNKHTGEEEGTGLGMWIIKSIVEDNDGDVKLIYPQGGGFGLRVIFPKKYEETKEINV